MFTCEILRGKFFLHDPSGNRVAEFVDPELLNQVADLLNRGTIPGVK